MPDNDKIIEQQLRALHDGIGNVGEHSLQLQEQITSLKREYEDKRDNATTPEKKREFADYAKALAGSLPDITKGTLSAITAFREQPPDAIGGSAAIMDILTGFSSALGPEGAALGAVFSMVSMILNFFAPKPPSLLDQIETLLRNLGADSKIQDLRSVGNGVHNWAANCDDYMKPAKSGDEWSHGGIKDPDLLRKEADKVNLVEGNALLTIWKAQEWLKDAANQELDHWPQVLSLHCEAYMRLRLAVTQVYLYGYDAGIRDKFVDKEGKHPNDPSNPKDNWGKGYRGGTGYRPR